MLGDSVQGDPTHIAWSGFVRGKMLSMQVSLYITLSLNSHQLKVTFTCGRLWHVEPRLFQPCRANIRLVAKTAASNQSGGWEEVCHFISAFESSSNNCPYMISDITGATWGIIRLCSLDIFWCLFLCVKCTKICIKKIPLSISLFSMGIFAAVQILNCYSYFHDILTYPEDRRLKHSGNWGSMYILKSAF